MKWKLVGRTVRDALRQVYETPADVAKVLAIVANVAEDPEAMVRVDLMEHVPHVAMLCHDNKFKLKSIIVTHLVPLVIKFLTDTDNQVRKTTHATLLVLMEQNLIDQGSVEEQMCPVILNLTRMDSKTEFHTGSVTLMSKMAPLLGCETTEKMFVPRITAYCNNHDFYVRKVCASNFGDFCAVVSKHTTENVLLPWFVRLCRDDVWNVRKACAEVIMSVSCACSLSTRKATLAPLFGHLLSDVMRWVRISAFQTLGPFITTFAEPSITGLAYNQQGELVLMNPEGLEFRLPILKNDPRFNRQHDTMFDPENKENVLETEEELGPDTEPKDQTAGIAVSREENNNTNNDATEIAESVISDVVAQVVKSIQPSADERLTTSSGESVCESAYNTFQYWREPLSPVVDDLPDIRDTRNYHSCRPKCSSSRGIRNEQKYVGELDNLHLYEGIRKRPFWSPRIVGGEQCSEQCSFNWEDLVVSNSGEQQGSCAEQLEPQFNPFSINMFSIPPVPDSHLQQYSEQNIVPQQLIQHFVSMSNPEKASCTDTDLPHHCAFSLPAVALTLGPENWSLLKEAYETLAIDRQWKVRRTVASSIHELAVIVGEDVATQDLVPIFNGLIKDLDEVRIGALKHLAHFLKLLRPAGRNSFLPRFTEFLLTDYDYNWRFREELAEQLLLSLGLFTPTDTCQHLAPVAISLLLDKVAAVRLIALSLVTELVNHISVSAHLLRSLLAELAQQFAHSARWNRRQTFAHLCARLVTDSELCDEMFARDVLPHLLDLAWDRVPNVRLAVARTISHAIMAHSYFCDEQSPHHDLLSSALNRLQCDTDRDVRYFARQVHLVTFRLA